MEKMFSKQETVLTGNKDIWRREAPGRQLRPLTCNGSFGAKECRPRPEISASCWPWVGSPQAWLNAKSEVGLQVRCAWGDTGQGPPTSAAFSAVSSPM